MPSRASAKAKQSESELAVDNSSGSDKGDIYFVDAEGVEIFNQAGEKIGTLSEEAGVPWGDTCGIAVDPAGNVYVGIYGIGINKYVPNGGVVTDSDYAASIEAPDEQCNVAVDSAVNVFGAFWDNGPVERWTASQFGTNNARRGGGVPEGLRARRRSQQRRTVCRPVR